MQHAAFHYRSLEEVRQTAEDMRCFLPLSQNTSVLFAPLDIAGRKVNNRIVFQPMEGADSTDDGNIGVLTRRRYQRFAKAGPGIIWLEAVATSEIVRATQHQLYLTKENADQFRKLNDEIRETSLRENGYAPLLIMQANNSGRYSKPHGFPEPLIAYNCPPLEDTPLPEERIVSDETLRQFEEDYGLCARLCEQAGFDGMDVKCCHRYLSSELLSAFNRPGAYGGSFENRTRFLKNTLRAARSAVSGSFILTSRLNVYDGFAYPNGWGVAKEGLDVDLTEPMRLILELEDEFHLPLLNITMGNPYKNPHVNRPYDHGNYVPQEHPFEGLSRVMRAVKDIQNAFPSLPIIGSAFSYLRQFSPYLAAGMVENGYCAFAGFGRMTLADPDFVRQLREKGEIDPKKTCVTCGKCAALLRGGKCSGCIVRDSEVYKL